MFGTMCTSHKGLTCICLSSLQVSSISIENKSLSQSVVDLDYRMHSVNRTLPNSSVNIVGQWPPTGLQFTRKTMVVKQNKYRLEEMSLLSFLSTGAVPRHKKGLSDPEARVSKREL